MYSSWIESTSRRTITQLRIEQKTRTKMTFILQKLDIRHRRCNTKYTRVRMRTRIVSPPREFRNALLLFFFYIPRIFSSSLFCYTHPTSIPSFGGEVKQPLKTTKVQVKLRESFPTRHRHGCKIRPHDSQHNYFHPKLALAIALLILFVVRTFGSRSIRISTHSKLVYSRARSSLFERISPLPFFFVGFSVSLVSPELWGRKRRKVKDETHRVRTSTIDCRQCSTGRKIENVLLLLCTRRKFLYR